MDANQKQLTGNIIYMEGIIKMAKDKMPPEEVIKMEEAQKELGEFLEKFFEKNDKEMAFIILTLEVGKAQLKYIK